MLRKSVLVLSLAAALLPVNVSGLGMGSIQLETALNQPLLAEIELLSADPETLSDLRVRLADEAAFLRAGMDRPYLLSKLRFKPMLTAGGQVVIQVTSQEPIREPFLNFLLELNWPSGRQVREYALLLDPPVTAESLRPAVQVPKVEAVASQQKSSGSSPSASDLAGVSTYGPTKSTDTAWVIADQVRPDKSVSIQQMMMALLVANPDAFDGGNVNVLKRGVVLKIPDIAQVRSMSARDAAKAFRQQTAEWRAVRSSIPTKATPRPVTRERLASPGAASDVAKPELDLVGGSERKGSAAEGAGSGGDSGEVQRLRRDLALVSEQADAARQDNENLRGSIADLAEQMREMQRLLVLRDQEMARLQDRLRKSASTEDVPKVADSAPVPPDGGVETGTGTQGGSVVTPSADADAKPKAPVVTGKPASVVAPPLQNEPPVEEAPWYAFLVEQPLIPAAAAGVLVLLGVLLVLRRRRETEEAEEEAAQLAPTSSASSRTAALQSRDRVEDPQNESGDEFGDLADNDGFGDDLGSEVDTLAEADVYMAYGRYSQAEELVRQALAKEPENSDLNLKMLEIYYGLRDKDRFSNFLEEAHESLAGSGGAVWRRVQNMGRDLVPDHALFSADGEASSQSEGDMDDISDLPTFDDDLADLEKDLDFDLGDPTGAKTPAQDLDESSAESLLEEVYGSALAGEATATSADDGRLLDFDMDFGADKKDQAKEESNELEFDLPGADKRMLQDDETIEFTPISDSGVEFDHFERQPSPGAEAGGSVVTQVEEPGSDDEGLSPDQVEEVNTKLDLARAYRDLGDADGALGMLEEVLAEGTHAQKEQAEALRREISA